MNELHRLFNDSYIDGAVVSTHSKPRVDGAVDLSHPSIAKKTREQINYLNPNVTDIQSIVASMTAKTIGVSVSVQVDSKSDTFNKQAERLIKEHSKIKVGELTGNMHFNEFARSASDFIMLHGGIIVRHHYNTAWKIPYKYELIGVDMIDFSKSEYNEGVERTNTTINGIVRNKWGVITHLWLFTTSRKTHSEKVPYDSLNYYSETWLNVDQQIAVSKLTTLLSKLDKTTQYEDSELHSAIEESKAGNYIQSTAYNELMHVVSDEIKKESNKGGSGVDRIKAVKDLITPILRDMANKGVGTKGLTPIPKDDTVLFNSAKKESQYRELNRNSEMKMASSQGLSDIGVFSKASEANYSSIKYTLETDQRTADIRFDNISNHIFNDIFTRLIQVGIQMGRIKDRVAYWKDPNAFNEFSYLRHNKVDTEPSKTALANEKNIELGIKTRGKIVEESTGVKYETFLAKKHEQELLALDYEIKLEKARIKAYKSAGIEMPTKDGEKEQLKPIDKEDEDEK